MPDTADLIRTAQEHAQRIRDEVDRYGRTTRPSVFDLIVAVEALPTVSTTSEAAPDAE